MGRRSLIFGERWKVYKLHMEGCSRCYEQTVSFDDVIWDSLKRLFGIEERLVKTFQG